MSYIENLTGSVVNASVQESLALGAGNFKIKGFDLTTSGSYKVLSSGLAIIDGLRIVSTGNLQILASSTLNKYIFLRINTYTQLENGITVRKADLSLIAQTSSTPVNSDDLYDNMTGTRDILLAFITNLGAVSYDILYNLKPYDSDWIALTTNSGFTGTAFYRIHNNILYFRGTISKGTGNIATGDIPTRLPAGILSTERNVLAVGTSGIQMTIIIRPNGDMQLYNVGTNTGVHFDAISLKM